MCLSMTVILVVFPTGGIIYEMINRKLTYEDLIRRYEYESEPEKSKGFFARLFGK